MTSLSEAFGGMASFISGHDFGEVPWPNSGNHVNHVKQEEGQGSKSTFLRPPQQNEEKQQERERERERQQRQEQRQHEEREREEEYVAISVENKEKAQRSKKNLWKTISYSFMILLAIFIYSSIEFWLKDFVATNDLTSHQELGIRLLLPVLVFFMLWNLM